MRYARVSTHDQEMEAQIAALEKSANKTADDAARPFGVHPSTVSRLLQSAGKQP